MTEGYHKKGGQNPPVPRTARPAGPIGSGGRECLMNTAEEQVQALASWGNVISQERANLIARIAELEARLAKYEQPDDGEPVDIRWLERLDLPFSGAIAVRLCDDGIHLIAPRERPSEGIDGLNDWSCPTVATRGQVRRLIAALKGEP